mmetsp:Transcript_13673/g.42279  ORF Transcript_13673/g.42279 Transcript_13673/m.42279 type:complete len:95 (+) Transcript_13673:191-475(+)
MAAPSSFSIAWTPLQSQLLVALVLHAIPLFALRLKTSQWRAASPLMRVAAATSPSLGPLGLRQTLLTASSLALVLHLSSLSYANRQTMAHAWHS